MPIRSIDITGLREALEKVRISWPELFRRAGQKAGEAVVKIAKVYPGQSRKGQPFQSSKQRRFFFAALRSGQIGVPYRRTNQLANAWRVEGTGAGADVTNSSPHSVWTIAPQTSYHKGNWPSEAQIAEKSADAATEAAEQEVKRIIEG